MNKKENNNFTLKGIVKKLDILQLDDDKYSCDITLEVEKYNHSSITLNVIARDYLALVIAKHIDIDNKMITLNGYVDIGNEGIVLVATEIESEDK